MIKAFLNGAELPPLEVDFISSYLDSAVDVTTLSNTMYTDFTSNSFKSWTLQWDSLTETEYEAIKSTYDSQFTLFTYPLLSIPYYGVVDVPVRMYINDRDVWNHCGAVKGVRIELRETDALLSESS